MILLLGATGAAIAASVPSALESSYVVEKGDTIRGIASSLGLDPLEIYRLNALDNPDQISIGQILRLPASSPGLPPASTDRAALSTRGQVTRLAWPLYGPITTTFGEVGPYWTSGSHPGLDIGAPLGAVVRAAAAGRVVEVARSGYNGGYGHYVKIDHGSGLHTLYCHLSAVWVDVGEWVGTGDRVGAIGMTGLTTGPHLHFEVRINGVKVDPQSFLP
ncbi:MAG TPA: LysM peptidoglycan-binding domain-containing M23 family metallopeptidase [Chloroflexota bacterium]|nr:LysM peptidoglycan-binding domain-containing M23 family metallopeptidase [Chloroflexota bacterium]